MLKRTILFLILLRLAIGWHFLFEGLHKVHTTYAASDTTRAFTSEGFFREAEGPAGPEIRKYIGDPDQVALAKLEVQAVPAGEQADKYPLYKRTPPGLDAEWDSYLKRFSEQYQLTPPEREQAAKKLEQSKDKLVSWLISGTKEVERKLVAKAPEVTVKMSVPERIDEYRHKLAEVREQYDRKLWLFGRDVEKGRLRETKGDAEKIRKDLIDGDPATKDLDGVNKFTKDMQASLADILRNRLEGSMPPRDASADPVEALAAYLTPAPGDDQPPHAERLPAPLAERWDAYAAEFKKLYRLTGEQAAEVDRRLARAKERTARWVMDVEEFPGTSWPRPGVAARLSLLKAKAAEAKADADPALKPDADTIRRLVVPSDLMVLLGKGGQHLEYFSLRKGLWNDVDRRTDEMKKSLAGVLSDDQQAGSVPEEKSFRGLRALDWLTRWGLTAIGACLLLGLFTRFSCVAAALFLVMTYLSVPAFPWLPVSPMNEGNYAFVNKNVVEFFALCVLATTRTGYWFGLDRLVSYFLSGRRRQK
jgi:uncharacterized membrane protein YphA (DoxX/SURF4 family)